jgi:hypothetical protein
MKDRVYRNILMKCWQLNAVFDPRLNPLLGKYHKDGIVLMENTDLSMVE